MAFKTLQYTLKKQFSIQKFIDLHLIKIKPQNIMEEFQFKNQLLRNKNFYHGEFLKTYKLYKFNEEEIDSIQLRQSSFFQDIQSISNLKLRATKVEKEISRRDKIQNQLTKQIKEKIMKKSELERQLFSNWIKFNNKLINFHHQFDHIAQKQLSRVNYRFLNLRNELSQNEESIQLLRIFCEQQIHIDQLLKDLDKKFNNQIIEKTNEQGNDFENYFNIPNLKQNWQKFPSQIGELLQTYFNPFLLGEHQNNNFSIYNQDSFESFHFTENIDETLQLQYQICQMVKDYLQKIYPQLKLNLWLIHPNNLHPFEASRVEITAMNDYIPGEFSISSCSNFLDYFTQRYGEEEKYIVQFQIQIYRF